MHTLIFALAVSLSALLCQAQTGSIGQPTSSARVYTIPTQPRPPVGMQSFPSPNIPVATAAIISNGNFLVEAVSSDPNSSVLHIVDSVSDFVMEEAIPHSDQSTTCVTNKSVPAGSIHNCETGAWEWRYNDVDPELGQITIQHYVKYPNARRTNGSLTNEPTFRLREATGPSFLNFVTPPTNYSASEYVVLEKDSSNFDFVDGITEYLP